MLIGEWSLPVRPVQCYVMRKLLHIERPLTEGSETSAWKNEASHRLQNSRYLFRSVGLCKRQRIVDTEPDETRCCHLARTLQIRDLAVTESDKGRAVAENAKDLAVAESEVRAVAELVRCAVAESERPCCCGKDHEEDGMVQ